MIFEGKKSQTFIYDQNTMCNEWINFNEILKYFKQ